MKKQPHGKTTYSIKRKADANQTDFWNQFDSALAQFFSAHPFDTMVLTPSLNKLDTEIASHILSVNPNTTIYTDIIHKLTLEDVADMCDKPGSYFARFWAEDYERGFRSLMRHLDEMERNGKVYFSCRDVKDPALRRSIIPTLKDSPLYAPRLNGKDLLLIDDTITHGQSMESACEALLDCYRPKSVSVLTAFSEP